MGTSYYGNDSDFYTEDTTPDRMGKGSSVDVFLNRGEINITNGIARIKESMKDILSTPVGTRFFLPQYGSKLYLLIYEQNDFIARDLAIEYTKQALTKWEPRIILGEVTCESDDKVLEITIRYQVKDIGTPGSYVYTVERQVPEML